MSTTSNGLKPNNNSTDAGWLERLSTPITANNQSGTTYFVDLKSQPSSSHQRNTVNNATFRKRPTPSLADRLPIVQSPAMPNNVKNTSNGKDHQLMSPTPSGPPTEATSLKQQFARRRLKQTQSISSPTNQPELGRTSSTTFATNSYVSWTNRRTPEVKGQPSTSGQHQNSPNQTTASTLLRQSLDQRKRSIEQARQRNEAHSQREASQRRQHAFLAIVERQQRGHNHMSRDNDESSTATIPNVVAAANSTTFNVNSFSGLANSATLPDNLATSFSTVNNYDQQSTDVDEEFSFRSSLTAPVGDMGHLDFPIHSSPTPVGQRFLTPTSSHCQHPTLNRISSIQSTPRNSRSSNGDHRHNLDLSQTRDTPSTSRTEPVGDDLPSQFQTSGRRSVDLPPPQPPSSSRSPMPVNRRLSRRFPPRRPDDHRYYRRDDNDPLLDGTYDNDVAIEEASTDDASSGNSDDYYHDCSDRYTTLGSLRETRDRPTINSRLAASSRSLNKRRRSHHNHRRRVTETDLNDRTMSPCPSCSSSLSTRRRRSSRYRSHQANLEDLVGSQQALDQINQNIALLQHGLERLNLQQQALLMSSAPGFGGNNPPLPVLHPPPPIATPGRATWDSRINLTTPDGPVVASSSLGCTSSPNCSGSEVDSQHPPVTNSTPIKKLSQPPPSVVERRHQSPPDRSCEADPPASSPPLPTTNLNMTAHTQSRSLKEDEERMQKPDSQAKDDIDQDPSTPPSRPGSDSDNKGLLFIAFNEEPDPLRLQRTCDRLEARRAKEKAAVAQKLEQIRTTERESREDSEMEQTERRRIEQERRDQIYQSYLAKKKECADVSSSTSSVQQPPPPIPSQNPYPVKRGPSSNSLSRSQTSLQSVNRKIRSTNTTSKPASTRAAANRNKEDVRYKSLTGPGFLSARGKADGRPTTDDADGRVPRPDDEVQSMTTTRSVSRQSNLGMSLSSLYRLGASDSCSSGPGLRQPRLFVKPKAKSNRMVIVNAISHCCLAGAVNLPMKQNAVKELSAAEGTHFMILFRDSRCQYRAIYSFDLDAEELSIICGTGPRRIGHEMVKKFYKYNSGNKQFAEIKSTCHLSAVVDAITIHDQLWIKSSHQPGALNLVPNRL